MLNKQSRISFIILPIAILLAFVCAFSLRAPASAPAYASDESTVKQIANAEELLDYVSKINDTNESSDYQSYSYVLTADLDLKNVNLPSIGTEARPFLGSFDAQGHIISNYTLIADYTNVGFFGYVGEGASIKSLGLVDGSITTDYSNVGGIAGYNKGTIENCFYQGTITGYSNVGGVVGQNDGIIRNSFSNGTIEANNFKPNLGGVIGLNNGALYSSYSIAKLNYILSDPNETITNIGGVIGGKGANASVPSYTFYNASLNSEIEAVGFEPNSFNATSAVKRSREEFNTLGMLTLLNVSSLNATWSRVYTITNHSAYVAPIQAVFAQRRTDVNLNENDKKLVDKQLQTACFERMYGIDISKDGAWGEEENPYLITTEQQLRNFQDAVTNEGETYAGNTFVQTRNINLSGRFYPIGSYAQERRFQGTYNGGHYSILNIDISESGSDNEYLGLFGYIGESATIKNLTIDGSVRGKQYVGSLVGYNYEGCIENIQTNVTVSAEGNCGGVVGLSRKGKYINILSKAKLNLIGAQSGGHFGIIGKYQEVLPETIQRVWYFVELGSDFTSTNGMGATFIADNHNGKIDATKSSDGTITFVATQTGNGYTMEYRTADENIIDNPTANDSSTAVIYGRFAKTFNKTVDATYASISLRGANKNGSYYTGQVFTLVIDIIEGTYVRGIVAKDGSGNIITQQRPLYSYDSNNTAVLYSAVMTDDLALLEIDVQRISFTDQVFQEKYTYNGQPVTFDVTQLDKPQGYNIVVVYSTESAPKNANQSALENYSLTLIYQNASGVRMGSRNVSFHIDKKQLVIDVAEGVLGNVKEWDNSLEPVPTTVEQSGVKGIVDGDVVLVSGMMKYNNVGITTDAVVTYIFTISGADASNYIAPITRSYDGYKGIITKRNITISFDSYEGVFAGLNKAPSLKGKKIIASGVLSAQPYEEVYTFEHVTAGAIKGSVGEYKLTVALSDATYPEADDYYNIQFADATDGYVIYTVKPLPVSAEYLIDGVSNDNIVYDGFEHNVSAYFINEAGAKVNLDVALGKGETSVDSLVGAGEYNASIINFVDANYDLGESATKMLTVSKAEQSTFSINSASTWDFGTSYTATTNGGSGTGAVSFEVDEEYGAFEGAILTIKKAGTIIITATKASDDNYNSAVATLELVVSKSELTIVIKDMVATYLDELTFVYETEGGDIPSGVEGVKVLIDGVEYNGETLEASTTPYQISIDVTNAISDGYELIAGTCGTLTINKLGITITADTQTSEYGEELKELSYVVTNTASTEIINVSLDGSLSTDAGNAGEFDITEGDIVTLNTNYDITFVSAKYTVTQKTLIVKATNGTKLYGEADPTPGYEVVGLTPNDTKESIGLNVNIGRMAGEESYMEGSDHTKVYNYFKISITHNSTNYSEDVAFETAYLAILPATPVVASTSQVNAVAGSTLSSNGNPTALIKGNVYDGSSSFVEQELAGTIAWAQDATLNFKESATLVYKAVFTPEDKNFTNVEFDVEVKVIPVEITVKFTSSKQVTYDGYDHNNVEYEITGLIAGDDAEDSISYEGDYKNAGSFKVKVTINNHNYKLIGGETTIKILKADVNIAVEDVTVVEGQTVSLNYMYYGLQRGDTQDSFKRLPSVVLPVKPGTYTLTPSGASADNYNISYESFTYKVLSKALANEEGDVNLEGAFDSATEFEMVESENYSEISNLYDDVQSSYANLENKDIEKVYELKYTIDGEVVVIDGEVYLTMLKPEGYEDSAVAYAIYTNNNELIYVQDIIYDGDYVTINVTNAKAMVFLAEQEEGNSMILYLAIGAGVVVVLIIALIVSKVKKRREARYIKYHED